LAWFWHIEAPNGEQGDQWMEECESLKPDCLCYWSNQGLEVYRVNWLRAKAQFHSGKNKSS